ncbi:MAG TPA: DUF2325 domain-containing protein [Candidatus Sulfotelmatobacter sp.]|jgi:hypothetical protein|nr:DUF2325 domain-containing protein [Candidatus Sulfotelmatobacter sp.]
MCESCETSEFSLVRTDRRKLWEIETGWHCMIVGTCVSMPELRRLANRLGIPMKKTPSTDYDVHSTMVYWASRDRKVGKELTKLMDKKFAPAIFRFSKIKTEQGLADSWREALESGEVAGALWALMSHPLVSGDLQNVAFGEMHMLSHQVGASSRADLRRVHGLEKTVDELEDKVSRQQERLRQEVSSRDESIRDLSEQLEQDRAELRRLSYAAVSAAEMDGLKVMVAELQRHLDLSETRHREDAERIRELEALQTEGERSLHHLRIDIDELRAENASLEMQLLAGNGMPDDRLASCDQSCARPDLCGRCILYVGGRANHVPHLRRIVEECKGTLVHHDGGFEESMSRLSGLMGQADAVMFPVDCISHMAHDHLKRLCKRWEKPFVPVRRSGVGAFLRALEAVGVEASFGEGGGAPQEA